MKNHSGDSVNDTTDWRTAQRRLGELKALTGYIGRRALRAQVVGYVWR